MYARALRTLANRVTGVRNARTRRYTRIYVNAKVNECALTGGDRGAIVAGVTIITSHRFPVRQDLTLYSALSRGLYLALLPFFFFVDNPLLLR